MRFVSDLFSRIIWTCC